MRSAVLLSLLLVACNGSDGPGKNAGDDDDDDVTSDAPTWHADIQPLVAEHCQACHVPGGAGPIAFTEYDDVRILANSMIAAIESGSMPPWPADPECREFEGQRLVPDADLQLLKDWVDADTPEGQATDDPAKPPKIAELEPTHTAEVPGYISTTTSDEYRCFILEDLTFDEPKYLKATQIVARSPMVHHVLAYGLTPDQAPLAYDADAAQPGDGYTCFGSPLPDTEFVSLEAVEQGFPNQLAAWIPGLEPQVQADDSAIRIEAGTTIVLQVHYSALGGDPAEDTSELQLVLTDEEPEYLVRTVPLLIPYIDIPAGQEDVRFTWDFTSYRPDPIGVSSFTSHMHLLGSQQSVDVLRADGTEECGLDIPDWDFDWQLTYVMPEEDIIELQTGDSLSLTCAYDNSAENQPLVDGEPIDPVDVEWGDGTLDEMCLLYISTVVPFEPSPPVDQKPCADTEQCVADCGRDLDCLLNCPETDADCTVCVLEEGIGCGMSLCAAGFLVDQNCITDCLISTMMLGGSTGACMKAECTTQYDGYESCAASFVENGSCDSQLSTCGFDL